MENQYAPKDQSLLLALYRLGLLVVPLAAVIRFCGSNPLICVLLCLGIMALWLCTDIGPFRAKPVNLEPKVNAKPILARIQHVARPETFVIAFTKVAIFVAVFHSRLIV